MLTKGEIQDLIEYMDDMKVTNEMVKEHLIGLCLKKNVKE